MTFLLDIDQFIFFKKQMRSWLYKMETKYAFLTAVVTLLTYSDECLSLAKKTSLREKESYWTNIRTHIQAVDDTGSAWGIPVGEKLKYPDKAWCLGPSQVLIIWWD